MKHRYPYTHGGRDFSIDVFQGRLSGLMLADLELVDEDELLAVEVPAWADADVTAEEAYEGGALAARVRSTACSMGAASRRTSIPGGRPPGTATIRCCWIRESTPT